MYKCFNFFSCNNYLSNWCLPINYVWISTCFVFFIENLQSEICLEGNLCELLCCASCYWCCDIVNIQQMEFISSPGWSRDIEPRQLLIFQHFPFSLVFCIQDPTYLRRSILDISRIFPVQRRGLVIIHSPDTNPVIKCFTFLLTIPHCRQSLSPQPLTKVKGSECLQIETHNSELIITLYSYLESGFWIVIVIMSVLKIQKYFNVSTVLSFCFRQENEWKFKLFLHK